MDATGILIIGLIIVGTIFDYLCFRQYQKRYLEMKELLEEMKKERQER